MFTFCASFLEVLEWVMVRWLRDGVGMDRGEGEWVKDGGMCGAGPLEWLKWDRS